MFLVSQYLTIQHSTEHLFHPQSDECLVFQIAASPSLMGDSVVFNLIQNFPESFQIKNDYFRFSTFIPAFSPRAPPIFSI